MSTYMHRSSKLTIMQNTMISRFDVARTLRNEVRISHDFIM